MRCIKRLAKSVFSENFAENRRVEQLKSQAFIPINGSFKTAALAINKKTRLLALMVALYAKQVINSALAFLVSFLLTVFTDSPQRLCDFLPNVIISSSSQPICSRNWEYLPWKGKRKISIFPLTLLIMDVPILFGGKCKKSSGWDGILIYSTCLCFSSPSKGWLKWE